jgi:hypothetical protein
MKQHVLEYANRELGILSQIDGREIDDLRADIVMLSERLASAEKALLPFATIWQRATMFFDDAVRGEPRPLFWARGAIGRVRFEAALAHGKRFRLL